MATPSAFRRDPELVWTWYDWRRELIAGCEPNAAHQTLADMERALSDVTLITPHVLRLTPYALRFTPHVLRLTPPLPDLPPRCPSCDGLLRPDVVLFSEALPREVLEAACSAAARCRTMLVIGTSAIVQPAASLPLVALRNQARLVEINPQLTPLSNHAHELLNEPAGEALPRWWSAQQG